MSQKAFFLQRLNDHIVYLRKIKATLSDSGDFCGSDYHLCVLGQWLYGEGREQASAIGKDMSIEFEKLFEPHKEFHESSSAAINFHDEANHEAMEVELTKMHVLSNTLVSSLLNLDSMAYNR